MTYALVLIVAASLFCFDYLINQRTRRLLWSLLGFLTISLGLLFLCAELNQAKLSNTSDTPCWVMTGAELTPYRNGPRVVEYSPHTYAIVKALLIHGLAIALGCLSVMQDRTR